MIKHIQFSYSIAAIAVVFKYVNGKGALQE